MYLKRLQIHGFKTFAAKTDFLFNPGITAIVGPNGCGKSNIADALRWVLGEQSFSALRSKKTEDVIFAGSSGRAPLGMAEVAITLDNSTGLLPLEFDEVTIARRAYRSGENEYYVNKSRVRLKDVEDVVSRAAQEYTVVNQGLADAALLLKPDQRRGLFEEAADISRLNAKRKEAEVKLAATEQNLLRVSDIAAELQPRLRSLRRQARQADAYQQLGEELRSLQREWYRRKLHRLQIALASAGEAEEKVLADRETGAAELARQGRRLDDVRRLKGEAQRQVAVWAVDQRNSEGRLEELSRRVAVLRERASTLEQQKAELAEELASLRATALKEKEELERAEQQLSGDRQESARLAEQVRQLEQQLAAKDRDQSQAQERLSRAQERSFALASRLAELRNRLAQLKERRQELAEQVRVNQETAKERRDLVEQRKAEAASILQAIGELDLQARQQTEEQRALEGEITAGKEKQRQLERAREELRRKEAEARTRLDTLSRLRDAHTGYYAGVKTVLQGAGKGGPGALTGIVGLVANLVKVPAEFEVAIEVALGGRLQDVVVERWADAEAAIALLKKVNGGRATFLPLHVIRASSPPRIGMRDGVFGLALDLIDFEERLRGVFGHLLGRTVVVRDLKVARELLAGEDQRFTIVTVSGEIVHPGGAVTGGSAAKQAGALSRERELRELPAELGQWAQEVRRHDDLIRQERDRLEHLQEKVTELNLAQRHRESLRGMHKEALLRSQQEVEQAQKQVNWYEPLEQKLRKEMDSLAEKELALKLELAQTETESHQAQATLQRLREETAAATRERALENEGLSELWKTAAAAEQVAQRQAGVLQTHRHSLERADEDIDRRLRKLDDLSSSGETLGRELGGAEEEAAGASAAIAKLAGLIQPAEENLRSWLAEETELEDKIARQNSKLLELETARGKAAVDLERSRGELINLQERAREDLGGEIANVEVAPEDGRWADLSEEELQQRVEQMAAKIQRIGPVNLAALSDYEEEASRLNHLETELNDLTQAAKSLRQVIRELDRLTHERFEATFAAVAEEFKGYFGRLFGGGSAKLVLTSPEDLQRSGIDIVAQPPGKRPQGLAALSGGERALTSTALLFAILKVNPSPFSLLDEVDAALDEANVGRFRACLQELSERTQFIVISHNQGTVHAADTIYGVSMGPDGASRVVSLELGRYDQTERESA